MSWAAECWARAQWRGAAGARLGTSERHLLLLLATIHSEIGETRWPSIPELAGDMDLTARRVQQLLESLERKGLLARASGRGRTHTSSYTLALPPKHETSDVFSSEPERNHEAGCVVPSIKDETSDVFPVGPDGKHEIGDTENTKSAAGKHEIATNGGGTIGGSTRGTSSSPSKRSKRVLADPNLSAREKGKKALEDAEFMTALREEYPPPIRIERQARRWLDHLDEMERAQAAGDRKKKPPSNFKNAFRNWLENAIKWGHEPGPETMTNGSTTGASPATPQRAPNNGAIGAAREREREHAAPGSGLGRFGRRT